MVNFHDNARIEAAEKYLTELDYEQAIADQDGRQQQNECRRNSEQHL